MSTGNSKPRFSIPPLRNPVGELMEEIVGDEVKRNVDLVSLYGEFGVSLTQKGHGFMGNCPWHEDTNPSLSVDREKGVYHCFGCGESGDAITLVRKMKGTGFNEAVTWLKQQNGRLSFTVAKPATLPGPAVSKPTENPKPKAEAIPKEPEKTKPERPTPEPTQQQTEGQFPPSPTESTVTLDDIVNHWAGVLETSLEAQSYLENRGLTDRRIWTRFRIGYSDGSLPAKLSNSQIEALKNQGIITKAGKEVFTGFIIVPLLDEQEKAVSLYGRAIAATTEPQHRYLSGPRRGLVNGKAASVYSDRLIVTESVIDALSLIQGQCENVIPAYGTGGVSDQMIAYFTDLRVKEVVIAFDADEAGRTAAAKLTERLLKAGVRVRTLVPDAAKDWNELLVSGKLTAAGIQAQIEAAPVTEPAADEQDPFRVTCEGRYKLFFCNDVTYRVLGVKELFAGSLRINIRAERDGHKYPDNVDLYSARSRMSFAGTLSARFGIETRRVERDLLAILEYLEDERDKALAASETSEAPELSEEEKAKGLEFLKSPDLMDRIVRDLEALGHVGEVENKQLVYLASVSRLFPKPLNIYVQAGSSGGKTHLLDTVKKLIPSEAVLSVTSFSDQALNYMSEAQFTGKIMIMGEDIHNETIQGQVRQMQSEGLIARMVTMKDPKTGELSSKIVPTKVQMCFMLSSTALYLNPENASRCLVLHVDESAEQTMRVQEAQRQKHTLEGYLSKEHQDPEIVARHHAAQRMLSYLPVFNPLAQYIRYPKSRPTMRRSQEHFLTLLDVVCLFRQYQKERIIRDNPYTGGTIEGIAVDLTDYRIAYDLFTRGVLLPNANELPTGAKLLYESIRALIRKKAKAEKLEATDVTVIQKEIRETSELGSDSVKKYIRALVDYEYLQLASGKRHGTRFSYRLREDAPIEQLDVSVIPSPEAIEQAMEGGNTV